MCWCCIPRLSIEVAEHNRPRPPSVDVIQQEMRTHIDLEFVLHVLGLAGTLVPELTSEEVLARMCRNKAKVAVRHTVRPRAANSDWGSIALRGLSWFSDAP